MKLGQVSASLTHLPRGGWGLPEKVRLGKGPPGKEATPPAWAEPSLWQNSSYPPLCQERPALVDYPPLSFSLLNEL